MFSESEFSSTHDVIPIPNFACKIVVWKWNCKSHLNSGCWVLERKYSSVFLFFCFLKKPQYCHLRNRSVAGKPGILEACSSYFLAKVCPGQWSNVWSQAWQVGIHLSRVPSTAGRLGSREVPSGRERLYLSAWCCKSCHCCNASGLVKMPSK